MKFFVLVIVVCAATFASAQVPPAKASTPAAITGEQWQQDLSFLVAKIRQMHPELFRYTKQEDFERHVSELNERLPKLSREEAIVGLMTVAASFRDGHTTVPPGALSALGMRVLPMRFYLYPDGVYLQAADRRYREVLGGKLIRIGDTAVEEAVRRLSGIVSHDNENTIKDRLPGYMIYPEVLAGLHIIERGDRVPLTFEVAGRTVRIEAEAVRAPESHEPPGFDVSYSSDWIDSLPETAVPLWLENRRKSYWMEYLADFKTVYVQFNQTRSDPQNPMPKFAAEVRAALAQPSVERAVLDLRLNSGGDGYWNKFLLLNFIRSTNIDHKGKLFVITGRRTFSAGSVMAIDMERFTNAVFVGEPTGGAVQNFGNHEPIVLPNSHLLVMIATAYYQNAGPFDDRAAISPEVAADLTRADYERGVDPAMSAILSYVPLEDRLKIAMDAGQPTEVRALFDRFKQESVNRYANWEPALNDVGYKFLHSGDAARAIALFQVATEEFPKSANAFDSLGDAYAVAGEKQRAIESYRQALKINPGWEPSRRSLEKLK